ncbi:MAG: DUF5714 domain-containing protein [Methanosarcinales archaeon]
MENIKDLQEFSCPIPLLKAREAIAKLKDGESITFIINFGYRRDNLKNLINSLGLEVIEEKEIGKEIYSLKVNKGKIRHFEHCMVCKEELDYRTTPMDTNCIYCGKKADAYIVCPNGHYVCDDCHLEPCIDLILQSALETDSKDPIKIAEEMMKLDKISMIGPEHHPIVPAAILAALKNANKMEVTNEKIKEGIRRAKKLPAGYCGLYGCCAAAMGVGVAISVLTDSTCMSDRERTLANRATARALDAIALEGGPRCCKTSVRTAIYEASGFLNDVFNVQLPISRMERRCGFAKINDFCKKERCRFFGK